jgi:hypothetical protein
VSRGRTAWGRSQLLVRVRVNGRRSAEARAWARPLLARASEIGVAVMLLALLAPAGAGAAGDRAAPDPAPQVAPAGSAGSAAPEAAPQAEPSASPGPAAAPAPGSHQSAPASPPVTQVGQGGSSGPAISRTESDARSSVESSTSRVATSVETSSGSHQQPAAHPRRPVHRAAARPYLGFPLAAGHRLAELPTAFTNALAPLARGDGRLMLLGALALAVLVFASSALLRLLARLRDEGWEWPGP